LPVAIVQKKKTIQNELEESLDINDKKEMNDGYALMD